MVHGLEAKYSGIVRFSYLDIDDPANNKFKQALNYRYQPHIFILDGSGNILNQWVGFVEGDTLDTAILMALGQ